MKEGVRSSKKNSQKEHAHRQDHVTMHVSTVPWQVKIKSITTGGRTTL